MLLSQVYCVWQVVKTLTIILNNPVFTIHKWFPCLFQYVETLYQETHVFRTTYNLCCYKARSMTEHIFFTDFLKHQVNADQII